MGNTDFNGSYYHYDDSRDSHPTMASVASLIVQEWRREQAESRRVEKKIHVFDRRSQAAARARGRAAARESRAQNKAT